MTNFIPLSVPNLKGNELKYITEVINDEWVSTAGSFINKFEEDIANYVGVKEAIACQSGTAGLHLSMMISGINDAHEVIVPTLTFIATVNPVSYCGAAPIFMDCDDTLNIDLDKVEAFCQNECILSKTGLINKKTNKLIKAIVIVHIFGNMVNMEKVMEMAQRYHLVVIEDAAEALGTFFDYGKYRGKFAGTIGDFGIYSFNGNKIITTGGGGMIVSNEPQALERARYLSTQAKNDSVYFIHDEVGFNYRMTNLQAAVGVAQLEQLEEYIKIKKRNYDLYEKGIREIEGLDLMPFNAGIRPNYWFYSLIIDDSKYKMGRDELLNKLHSRGIQTRPIWGLIHQQKPYRQFQTYKIEKAQEYLHKILNIPCSSNLTEENVTYVLENLELN